MRLSSLNLDDESGPKPVPPGHIASIDGEHIPLEEARKKIR